MSSTLQEVTKRSNRMQKHLKFTVLYSWNPFYINEDVITHNQILLYYTSHFPPHHTYAWRKLLNPCPYITVQLDHITHVIPIFNQWYLWIQHPKAHNTTRQCGLSFIPSSNHWHKTTSTASSEINTFSCGCFTILEGTGHH